MKMDECWAKKEVVKIHLKKLTAGGDGSFGIAAIVCVSVMTIIPVLIVTSIYETLLLMSLTTSNFSSFLLFK